MSKSAYPNWQRRHEAVLNWLLSHTSGKLYECARATGYSPWQVSRIINSPDFQAIYKKEVQQLREAAFQRRWDKLDQRTSQLGSNNN